MALPVKNQDPNKAEYNKELIHNTDDGHEEAQLTRLGAGPLVAGGEKESIGEVKD